MDNYFRVKYKNGDFEVEVESSDKDYVDSKLDQLMNNECADATKKDAVKKKSPRLKKKVPAKASVNSSNSDSEDSVDITAIVSAINDDNDHEKIEQNILNKSGQLPRIIMCLYFSQSVLGSTLTTGDIQTITDQLGIKIGNANAANTIKANLKYFAADTVRKKGAVVRYKLNRKGNEAYSKILNGEKV